MAELGSGSGTGYPGSLDTYDTSVADDVDDVKADHMNDVNLAVIAIQNELGVDPAGSAATVVARIDAEHNADGSHSDVTVSGKLDTSSESIASATTTNIGAATANYLTVSGTTTITAFDTVDAGIWRILKFDASLTLTHNGTSLILPGSANITTAAGDVAIMVSEGSGNWRCAQYLTATDLAKNIRRETVQASTSGTSIDFTGLPAGANRILVIFDDVSLDGTDSLLVQIGDSGGLETSGYKSNSLSITNSTPGTESSTSGFVVRLAAASREAGGVLELIRITGNDWVARGNGRAGTTLAFLSGGLKSLSAELDRLSVVATGTDNFDAGQINVFVEV